MSRTVALWFVDPYLTTELLIDTGYICTVIVCKQFY